MKRRVTCNGQLGLDGSAGAARRLWVTLMTAKSEALRRAGAERDARSRAEQAIMRARPLNDPELLARAALAYAGRRQGFGDAMPDGAVADVLREVLRALPPQDSALRALTMARLSEELAVTVTVDDRRSLGREAMRMARRLDDPAVIASVIHTAHWALWHPEESDDRLMLADEAIALAERLSDRATLLEGALLRFWSLLDVGDFSAARTQLDVAGRLVETARQPYYEWLVLMGRTALAYGAAPVPDVEALAAEALNTGHRAQNPNAALFYAAQVGSWPGSRGATRRSTRRWPTSLPTYRPWGRRCSAPGPSCGRRRAVWSSRARSSGSCWTTAPGAPSGTSRGCRR